MRVSSSSGSKANVAETCETFMIIAETEKERKALAVLNAILSDEWAELSVFMQILAIGAGAYEAAVRCEAIP